MGLLNSGMDGIQLGGILGLEDVPDLFENLKYSGADFVDHKGKTWTLIEGFEEAGQTNYATCGMTCFVEYLIACSCSRRPAEIDVWHSQDDLLVSVFKKMRLEFVYELEADSENEVEGGRIVGRYVLGKPGRGLKVKATEYLASQSMASLVLTVADVQKILRAKDSLIKMERIKQDDDFVPELKLVKSRDKYGRDRAGR